MLNRFAPAWYQAAGPYHRHLEARVPVEPWDHEFRRMSGPQMETFETRLKDLIDASPLWNLTPWRSLNSGAIGGSAATG